MNPETGDVMSRRGSKKISVSQAVMLAMDMTRGALKALNGGDFKWWQTDIEPGPEEKGRSIGELRNSRLHSDANIDEITREIFFKGRGTGCNGIFDFEAVCVVNRFRTYSPIWDPWYLNLKIPDSNDLQFVFGRRPKDHKYVILNWYAIPSERAIYRAIHKILIRHGKPPCAAQVGKSSP